MIQFPTRRLFGTIPRGFGSPNRLPPSSPASPITTQIEINTTTRVSTGGVPNLSIIQLAPITTQTRTTNIRASHTSADAAITFSRRFMMPPGVVSTPAERIMVLERRKFESREGDQYPPRIGIHWTASGAGGAMDSRLGKGLAALIAGKNMRRSEKATPEQQLAMAKALQSLLCGGSWPPDSRSLEAHYLDSALQVWAVAEDNASPQPDR